MEFDGVSWGVCNGFGLESDLRNYLFRISDFLWKFASYKWQITNSSTNLLEFGQKLSDIEYQFPLEGFDADDIIARFMPDLVLTQCPRIDTNF